MENAGQRPAGFGNGGGHLRVYGVERRSRHVASANARLIGGHGHGEACAGEVGDRIQAAGKRLPLRRRANVILALCVDDTVAVENNQPLRLAARH